MRLPFASSSALLKSLVVSSDASFVVGFASVYELSGIGGRQKVCTSHTQWPIPSTTIRHWKWRAAVLHWRTAPNAAVSVRSVYDHCMTKWHPAVTVAARWPAVHWTLSHMLRASRDVLQYVSHVLMWTQKELWKTASHFFSLWWYEEWRCRNKIELILPRAIFFLLAVRYLLRLF